MRPDISHLLTELYSADPSLKEHEKVLKPILKQLVAARPDAPIDEKFKAELRTHLWAKIEEVEGKSPARFSWPKALYAFGGAAVAALILVPVLTLTLSSGQTMKSSSQDQNIATMNAGKGGGGGRVMSESLSADEDTAEAIYPDYIPYTTFTYKYTGDEISLDGAPAEVLTKEIDESSGMQIDNWLSTLDLDLINLEKFKDFKLSYLTLEPENGAGYTANLDYVNNMISLSYWDDSNWDGRWEENQNSKEISDEKALQIAADFVQKYNLDLSDYGDPIVDQQDSTYYDSPYVSVIYPVEQNGLTLYQDWGTPDGINISIYIQDEHVDSLWGLTPQIYSSEKYDSITDTTRLIEIAEQGGQNGYIDPYADKIVELDLGTPFKGLTKTYDYNSNEYVEKLVPALIFPITENHEDNYQDYIVVPLVEEFLNNTYPDEPVLLEEAED